MDALWAHVQEDKILEDHVVCNLTVADPDDPADFVLDENLISKLELHQLPWSWACLHRMRLPMIKAWTSTP
jgi:hypothetical protein